jgi:hypothetical protein
MLKFDGNVRTWENKIGNGEGSIIVRSGVTHAGLARALALRVGEDPRDFVGFQYDRGKPRTPSAIPLRINASLIGDVFISRACSHR